MMDYSKLSHAYMSSALPQILFHLCCLEVLAAQWDLDVRLCHLFQEVHVVPLVPEEMNTMLSC